MTNTVFIYALNEPCSGPDPTAGRTRYVGKAVDPYARYEAHLESCERERTYKANWIRSLLKVGKTPILEILDEVPEAEWQLWEQEWIRLYRALGFKLTNGTDGGEGNNGIVFTQETRVKMKASHTGPKNHFFGRKHSSEANEKNRLAHLGKSPSDEARAKSAAVNRGRKDTLETRAKKSAAMLGEKNPNFGKKQSADHVAKRSAARRKYYESNPEARAKKSAAWIGEKNPNFGKKRSAESRAKQSASLLKYYESKKSN